MARKGKYYTRPDGLKEAIRTINGKRVAFRGKTDREVDRKILEYKEEAEKGRKLSAVADEWESSVQNGIREATKSSYKVSVEALKKHFDGAYIKDIRPLDIKRYFDTLGFKGYSKSTVQLRKTVCNQVFAYAVMRGDIDVSPVAEVKIPKGLPKKKRAALTEEQEEIVKKSGIDKTARFWLFPYLLLYTGLRRGEALALTYADIDRKNKVIHITKKVNYTNGSRPKIDNFLKSDNGLRDVPLLPQLERVLPQNAIGLVFPGKDGGYMTTYQTETAWESYCQDVGFYEIDENGDVKYPITPHCFRHSFATICYEAGLDSRAAAKILGDDPQTMELVYIHLRENKKQTAAEKLMEYMAATV